MNLMQEEKTLIDALVTVFPDSSRRTLQNWIRGGRIYVDDSCILKTNHRVEAGQTISLGQKEPRLVENLPLLFEDRWIIVIDKPIGLLSVPTDHDSFCALSLLRLGYRSTSIFAVHRIDQETSGVLMFARGVRSEKTFDAMFEEHALKREYFAIVSGRLPSDRGTWESYLREKANYDVEVTTPELGKRAVTHYEVIKRTKMFSYLKLTLETGKKHQIRVHCAEAGYPVVGDFRYGSLTNPLSRLGLHAHRLEFIHPFTNKKMVFLAPIPRPFSHLGFPK